MIIKEEIAFVVRTLKFNYFHFYSTFSQISRKSKKINYVENQNSAMTAENQGDTDQYILWLTTSMQGGGGSIL